MKNIVKNLKKVIVHHAVFQDVEEQVLSQLATPCSDQIILITGPTGAGKSTLCKSLVVQLKKWVIDNPESGFGPPVVIEACEPERGEFDWKDFYWNALHGPLGEPGMTKKIDISESLKALRENKTLSRYRGTSIPRLRELFIDVVNARKPIVVFIDEIQAAAKTRNSIRRGDNMDVIKTLSINTNSTFIPIGTYEARKMLYASGQAARRVTVAHMRRYTLEELNSQYKPIIEFFCDELGVPLSASVRRDVDYLYNQTIGCVGILSEWFVKSINLAIGRKKRVIDRDILEKVRLRNIQLAGIAAETIAFETEHASEGDFNLSEFFKLTAPDAKSVAFDYSNDSLRQKRTARTPGRRAPARDAVGNSE